MSVDASHFPDHPSAPTASGLTPEPERSEAERLDPQPVAVDAKGKQLTLSNGAEVVLLPLRLRQFLRLLRILTRGAAANMDAIDLDMDDGEKFIAGLLSLLLFAVPEAEDEVIEFIQSIVEPAALAKAATPAESEARFEEMFDALLNPSLDDTMDILQRLVEVEGEDIRALGKRIQKMFTVAMAAGALDQNKDVQIP